jgi:hypothetical protein
MLKIAVAHTGATLGGSIAAVISMYYFLLGTYERFTLQLSLEEKGIQFFMMVILMLHGVAVGILVWFGLVFFLAWCIMSRDEYITFTESFFGKERE